MASHRKSRRSKPSPLTLVSTPTARAALTLALAGAASLGSLQGSAHAQPRTPSPGEQIKSTVDRLNAEAAATASSSSSPSSSPSSASSSSSHIPNGSNADGARQTRDTAPAQSAEPAHKPVEPAKPAKPAEPTKPAEPAQSPKQAQPAKPAKSPEQARPTKAAKPAKAPKHAKPSKPAKAAKPAKSSKPAKSARPAKSAAPAKSSASRRATRAVAFARQALGKPYVWGATGPSGYDCSGLTQAAWRAAGISLPRTTYTQINAGKRVSRSQLRPGDLVFFYSSRSHVGIYVGDGRMIHAPRPGRSVRVSPIDQMPFAGATRPG
ncbi:hypothetical protein GCM10009801_29760 [Streptomyces albiaxialis]|uniref:NlpC/P60 domain-containing protein n=1 Tax=Streptomyces albiaxialis TaxID=329523 RepID=A0ABP5HGD1_9ACTN